MRKLYLIIIISILNLNFSLAQTESEIDSLLNGILKTENSKEITKTEQAEKLIAFGENSLPILAKFFTDSTLTKTYSECLKRKLTKGELAIILADRIEGMTYALLTGVQNCLMEFCENNPNWIEYYLPWINKDGIEQFQKKYQDWIVWTKLSDKEKRKIERINTRKFKKMQREFKKNPGS